MEIGKRIKQARAMKGASQRDLAKWVNLSATTISKYERGLVKPGSDVLIQVADALDIKIDYFLRSQRVTDIEPAYRKRAAMGKKAQRSLIEQIRDWLERYSEAEALSTAELAHFRWPNGFPRCVNAIEDAETAAEELRTTWQIGFDPIENLVSILEDKGIKVGVENANDQFDACAFMAQLEENVPVIVLNADLPGDRQRFTLAHELGHIMLNAGKAVDEEKVVNRFAGAFLAPRESIQNDLGKHRKKLSVEELHLLKHKYGLSMQSIIFRAKDLEIISENIAGSWFRNFRARGWYANEPGDPVLPEYPERFKLMVLRVLSEGLISEKRATELYGESVHQDNIEESIASA